MADDTAEVVRMTCKDPVHLVGWSMGGCIAQDVAVRALFPLANQTLIASTAGGAHYTTPGAAVLKALSEPRGEQLLDYFVATWHVCMGEETTTKHWDELLEIFAEQAKHLTPRRTMQGHLSAYARFDLGARLGELRVPTRIIAGADDPLTPVANSRALARLIPGAILHELPGIKHNPHTECPERLGQLLGIT
jgi:pimeloyl-ACP methyl ester carboxylesterase